MIYYEIIERWTKAVKFTAKIDCDEDAPDAYKKRLAISWAIDNTVDFTDTDLRGANLSFMDFESADFTYVDLRCADLSGSDFRRCKLDNVQIDNSARRAASFGAHDFRIDC